MHKVHGIKSMRALLAIKHSMSVLCYNYAYRSGENGSWMCSSRVTGLNLLSNSSRDGVHVPVTKRFYSS